MYLRNFAGSSCLESLLYPAKRVSLCGISSPPSRAPLSTANTRAPVVVRAKPTSNRALNGLGPSSFHFTANSSPFT